MVEKILEQTHPSLPKVDRARLADFATGFPLIATLLAEAQLEGSETPLELSDETIVRKLVEGRPRPGTVSGDDLWSVLEGLAIFDNVHVEDGSTEEFHVLARQVCGLTCERAYRVVVEQAQRGIVQVRGRFGRVIP